MTCEEFLETVATATLPELDRPARRAAMDHLHSCRDCRTRLATDPSPMTKAERARAAGEVTRDV